MNKIKIGFDFDKVFVDYPPFIPARIIEMLYKKRNGNLSYRIPGEIEKKIRIISHHQLLRPALSKNITAMQRIFENKNVETFIISSRFSFLKNKTYEWNRRHNMENYFKKMYFNFSDKQPHVFKEEILRKEKIDKFIDDDLDLLVYLSERNPNISFYWISDLSKVMSLPSNISRIRNLEEFLEKYV